MGFSFAIKTPRRPAHGRTKFIYAALVSIVPRRSSAGEKPG
jgi:hypothetical protein